ncbi:MAG: NfeD family protein [Gammaproteobacteria bacterium]|nr:NfeD family protein [Gammaproteobacteria bacterium]
MEFFTELNHWHWLILVLLLLAGEAMGAAGFLLGAAGAAATLVVLNLINNDLSWQTQISVFGAVAVILSWRYWKQFRSFNEKTDHPELNDRAAQLVGRTLTLSNDLVGGEGKEQIGDTFWRVRAQSNLPAATQVKVTGTQDRVLLITESE